MATYMHGERQRTTIVQTGLRLWHERGQSAVTARGIGKLVGLSHAGVIYHFGGVAGMLEAIKAEAIRSGDKLVIAQLITTGDAAVAHFTDEQRRAWLTAGV